MLSLPALQYLIAQLPCPSTPPQARLPNFLHYLNWAGKRALREPDHTPSPLRYLSSKDQATTSLSAQPISITSRRQNRCAMSFISAQSTPSNTQGDLSKDIALTSPPEDSISQVAFSPAADFLAVSSWDKKVRIYQVSEQGQSEGKAQIDCEAPALCCTWSAVRIDCSWLAGYS